MELVNVGWQNQMGHIPSGFLPSNISGLKLWWRFNSGITETGLGVSQWDDASGEGNHGLQATDAARPQKQADGSILFDGLAHFLKANAFTLVQPETIYILGKQITWTGNDSIFDGNAINSGRLLQYPTSRSITCYAGDYGASSTELVLDTYGTIAAVFDHDNSLNTLQINNNAPSTDAAFGINDMGGFTLGAIGGGVSGWSNIQVKEVLIYNTAHDAAQRAQVINYLQGL